MKKDSPRISFNPVGLLSKKYKKEILKKISRIIDSGIYINGEEARKLENNLLHFQDKGFLATTASGHDALILALSSLNLSSRDEIIFPVNSYPTAFPVALSRGKPIPVDIDKNGQLNLSKLEQKINKNTKAVIVVHLYGLIGDIEKLIEITRRKKIVLIEDCAQALGSTFKNKPIGISGDIACFSFYPTKNWGTLGDGGAIWTKHKRLYNFFVRAKSYGEVERYKSDFVAGHSRIPEIQAGILNIFFTNLKISFQKRRELFLYYKKRLKEKELTPFVRVLESNKNSEPVPHLFVLEVKNRDLLQKYLADKGIETHIHYPQPIHLLPAFSYLSYKKGDFPVAERLSDNILSLPFHQYLTNQDIDYIVSLLKNFYA